MADPALLSEWEQDFEASAMRTRRARWLIGGMILLPMVFMLLLGNLLFVVILLGELAILWFVIARLRRPARDSEPAPFPEGVPQLDRLRDDVATFAQSLGLYPEEAAPLLDRADLSVSPSVRSLGEGTYIHVPLGFVTVYAAQPDEARAIIAHEVAHVRQDDWRIWATLSGFLTVLKWVVLPVVALSLLTSAASMIDVAKLRDNIQLARDDLRDYATVIDDLRETRSELTSAMPSSGLPSMLGISTLPDEALAEAERQVFVYYVLAVALLIATLLRFGMVRLLARRRAESEYLADRAAAILTSPEAVARAVGMLGRGRPSWALLSSHLRSKDRIAALERSFGALSEPLPGEALVGIDRHATPRPLFARLGRLTGGNGLHRLFGWGGTRIDWRRFAAMAAALILAAPVMTFVGSFVDPPLDPQASGMASMLPIRQSPLEPLFETWRMVAAAASDAQYSASGMIRRLAEAASFAVALSLVRRDDIATLLALTLSAVAGVAINMAMFPEMGFVLTASGIALAVLWNAMFFVPLSVALSRGHSVGKSAMIAVLASAVIGLAIDALTPSMWARESMLSFAERAEARTQYDLVMALMLLGGNAAASRLRRITDLR